MIKNINAEKLEYGKLEKFNNKHTYKIINLTTNTELTLLLESDSLSITRALRTADGKITPSTLSLNFIAQANDIDNKILVKNFRRKYKEYPKIKWKDILTVEDKEEYLVSLGDIIEVYDYFYYVENENEPLKLFTGIVRDKKILDTFKKREISITLEDLTIKGYENKFSEDIFFEDYYIANNEEKEKSLLHIIAKDYLKIESEIENVKINDTFLKIPLVKFEKGKKIMEELGEIVRSIYGNIYITSQGKLKINSFLDKSYLEKTNITLGNKKGNYPILEFIEKVEIEPKENEVEVNFSNIKIKDESFIFSLMGQNVNIEEDDARIVIKANSPALEWWKIDFKDSIGINKKPVVKAYKYNGEVKEEIEYNEYILEWLDGRNAKVKFDNSKDYDVYLKEFKFKGQELIEFKNDTVSYSETINTIENKNTLNINYKYIYSQELALEIAKHTFYNQCRPYNTIKLKTNNIPFLELEDIITLDFNKYKGEYIVISITQTNLDCELVLRQYKEYEANDENFITIKSNNVNEEMLRSKAIIELEKDKFKMGEYEYNILQPLKINDFNVNLYNIYAYFKEIPLNVTGGVKAICEVIKENESFYIKVGIANSNNEIIQGGKAIWYAIRKGN